MKSINLWKIGTVGFAGLSAVLIGYAQIPQAEAGDMCKGQPHMKTARQHLVQAKTALDAADHNKKGWRKEAAEATELAIKEVNTGCDEADKP